jgi:hypothetical protein
LHPGTVSVFFVRGRLLPSAGVFREDPMEKKFIVAWFVIFIAWFLGSFVVHGLLLQADYMQLSTLMRTEADAHRYFPLMILAHLSLAGAFVWIYSRGVEARPWVAQGLRFGIAVALLTTVPTYLIYFVIQPMPWSVVVKQIVFESILILVLGVIVAGLYRRTPNAV